MKKRIIISVLFFSPVCFSLSAQTLLKDGRSWHGVERMYFHESGSFDRPFIITVSGDTTVSGESCKRLRKVWHDTPQQETYFAAIEKDSRLYDVTDQGKHEFLNFRLSVGDTDGFKGYVISTDEIMTNGVSRRRITIDRNGHRQYLVDGIGLSDDYLRSDTQNSFYTVLDSVTENGLRVFSAQDFHSDDGGKDENPVKNHPRFFTDGVKWYWMDGHWDGAIENGFTVYKFEVTGDTVIRRYEYKIIESTPFSYGDYDGKKSMKRHPSSRSLFLREDEFGNVFSISSSDSYQGYDRATVDHFVINYGIPWNKSDYIHCLNNYLFSPFKEVFQVDHIKSDVVSSIMLKDGLQYPMIERNTDESVIYGIGSTVYGPEMYIPLTDCESYGFYRLLDFYRDGKLLYVDEGYDVRLAALFRSADEMAAYDGHAKELVRADNIISQTSYYGFTPDIIYDLQGRRLSRKPERGIYIQGGKKVLAR